MFRNLGFKFIKSACQFTQAVKCPKYTHIVLYISCTMHKSMSLPTILWSSHSLAFLNAHVSSTKTLLSNAFSFDDDRHFAYLSKQRAKR